MSRTIEKFKLDQYDARDYIENFTGQIRIVVHPTTERTPPSLTVDKEEIYYVIDALPDETELELELEVSYHGLYIHARIDFSSTDNG